MTRAFVICLDKSLNALQTSNLLNTKEVDILNSQSSQITKNVNTNCNLPRSSDSDHYKHSTVTQDYGDRSPIEHSASSK